MRTVEIEGRAWEVRGLKRKQVKELKKGGINLADLAPGKADEAMDAVFAKTFSAEDVALIDEMLNADAMRLWVAIIRETFGATEEEKNS